MDTIFKLNTVIVTTTLSLILVHETHYDGPLSQDYLPAALIGLAMVACAVVNTPDKKPSSQNSDISTVDTNNDPAVRDAISAPPQTTASNSRGVNTESSRTRTFTAKSRPIKVESGVPLALLVGVACFAFGCIAVARGNTAGWVGIVFGILDILFAASLQKRWMVNATPDDRRD